MEIGVRKIEMKERMVPTRKRANIQWDARRTSARAEITFCGRATTREKMSEG